MRSLVQNHEYGVVGPADVRAAAQAASGVDLSAFWARWRDTGD